MQRLAILRGSLSKAAFARSCEIKPTTMLDYLNGNTEPQLSVLRKIADAHGVTVGWLVDDETVIYKDKPAQSVVGNGNVQAGGKISGTVHSTLPPAPIEGYLSPEEMELITMIRDLGGRRIINKFRQELIKLQEIIDGG